MVLILFYDTKFKTVLDANNTIDQLWPYAAEIEPSWAKMYRIRNFISALPITRYSLGSRFTELPFSVILILELASVSRAEFCSCLGPEGRMVLDMRMLISRLDQRFFVFQCTFNLERFLLECRKIVIFYPTRFLKNWRQFFVQLEVKTLWVLIGSLVFVPCDWLE